MYLRAWFHDASHVRGQRSDDRFFMWFCVCRTTFLWPTLSCISRLHTITWPAAISLHRTYLASAPLPALDRMNDGHGTRNLPPRAAGSRPHTSPAIVDILTRSRPDQNAPRQRGDLAAGSNMADLQIKLDAVCRRLVDTVQAHGLARRVSHNALQSLISPRAQRIVEHMDGVLQGLIHSTAQEIVQDLETRELSRQISTKPLGAPLSDEERRLIDAVAHSVPGIRSASSRQPAPLELGGQALSHRPRPPNTALGSEPRQPAQKRKVPESEARAPSGEGSERHSTSLTTETDSDFGREAPCFRAAMGRVIPSSSGLARSEISNDAFGGAAGGGHISNHASQSGRSGGTSRDAPPGRTLPMNVPSMDIPSAGDAPVSGAVGIDPVVDSAAGDDSAVVSTS